MRRIFIGLLITLFTSTAFSSDSAGISAGKLAPQILAQDITGSKFDLKKSLKAGPTVLVFYRGGWCPYCNRQLRKLQADIVPMLDNYSAKLVAISVDKLDEIVKTQKKENLGMTLVSDPTASIIKSYHVVNQMPESLVKTYKNEYGIDLERSSGQNHHIIAVPAVFVIAQDGKIAFSYANEDYTIRTQNKDILSSLGAL